MIAVSQVPQASPRFGHASDGRTQIATRFEQIFHDSFYADIRRTLAVICFTLGTWVAGCTQLLPLSRQ